MQLISTKNVFIMSMMNNNNVILLFLVLIPPIIYALIVKRASPRGVINVKVSFLYFLMGIVSTTFVTGLQWIFPNLDKYVFDNMILSIFCLTFLQVALVEETMKYISFRIINSYIPKRRIEHPAAKIFYMMSVGTGFAVFETITDFSPLDPELGRILFMRTFTSLLIHMINAIFMGYFYFRFVNSEKCKKIVFGIMTLLIPVVYHGIYDFILFTTNELGYGRYDLNGIENKFDWTNLFSICIVFVGLLVAFKLTREIFKGRQP